MSHTRAVWFFILGLTSIRLTLLGTTDLTFDEAYYWLWSERLAPGYFSKGPGIAFAIRASTAIFGPTEFGVRFWSPLLGAGTSLLIYYFTRRLFNAKTAFWTVIALNAIPLLNVGNVLMTIDSLSIFFWAAAMFAFWLAIERSPNFNLFWPLTGLLVGLGFLSKYTNAFEFLSIVLVLALAPRLRREFKRVGFYSLLAVFVICALPPIIWNAQNAWITITHLRARGSLDQPFGIHPRALLGFLGVHFLFYSPLVFLGLAWAVIANWRRARQQFKVLYLFWFGLPVFAFYFVLSINKQAAPNWDALAFISWAVLAAAFWYERLESKQHWRPIVGFAVLIGLGMSMIALDTDILRTTGIPIFRRDPVDRMRGWRSAAGAVEKLRGNLEGQLGERLFMIADQRDRASELSFYLRDKHVEGPGHPPVYIVESQDLLNQFSFWPRYDQFIEGPATRSAAQGEVYTEESGINPFEGRNALYIQSSQTDDLPHNIRAAFQSVEKVGTVEVRRFGAQVRELRIFLCRNYRTLPL